MPKTKKPGSKKKGKKGAANKGTVTVKVVPLKGESTETVVTLASSATVGSVLQSAGIATTKQDLSVNGKPAALTDALAAGATVTVTERAQGS